MSYRLSSGFPTDTSRGSATQVSVVRELDRQALATTQRGPGIKTELHTVCDERLCVYGRSVASGIGRVELEVLAQLESGTRFVQRHELCSQIDELRDVELLCARHQPRGGVRVVRRGGPRGK